MPPTPAGHPPARRTLAPRVRPANSSFDPVAYAREYLSDHGLAVVPIARGTKVPHLGWKEYQTRRPTPAELDDWWERWPRAGIGGVLGPVSDIIAVDVDGPDAHDELVARLGAEPAAPKVLTGSRKPCRYQLLFRHPTGLATRAKATPWHPALEFRGTGGLSVLPYSVHASGHRYDWARDRSLDDLPPPALPGPILDELRRLAERSAVAAGGPRPLAPVRPSDLDRVQRQALAWITKRCRAVAGQGGDKETFTAACYLVVDFGLEVDQAWPVLESWNRTNCVPPWTDAELRHKLEEAEKVSGQRGRLLADGSPAAGSPPEAPGAVRGPADRRTPPAPAAAFATPVPDSALADWTFFKPGLPPKRRNRSLPIRMAVMWLALAAVVLQKSSAVRLPDVAVGQLIWGGDLTRWPGRWREMLRRWLKRFRKVPMELTPCAPGCPLNGRSGLRHKDVRVAFESPGPHDLFNLFRVGVEDGVRAYDFSLLRSHHPDPDIAKDFDKVIRQARSTGRLVSVYLPAWVFGPVVLAPGPCRILQSLTREVTRVKDGRSDRADKAAVTPAVDLPLPRAGGEFVGLNGNGRKGSARFHGYGYRLAERMKRAGYPADPADARRFTADAKRFVADLKSLLGPFGLAVAVRAGTASKWRGLDALSDDIGVAPPRRLAEVLVRVFAPADYPARWRAYFASRLGVSAVPAGLDDVTPAATPAGGGTPVETGEQLARWMRESGWTDATLAARLGVSRSLVYKCRTGRRPLTPAFRVGVAGVAAGDAPG